MVRLTRLTTLLGLVVLWWPGAAAAFSAADLAAIFTACQTTANATPSAVRPGANTKMWCAVVDREGALQQIQATDTGEAPAANRSISAPHPTICSARSGSAGTESMRMIRWRKAP